LQIFDQNLFRVPFSPRQDIIFFRFTLNRAFHLLESIVLLVLLSPFAISSNDWVIDPRANYLFQKTSEEIEPIPLGENFESLNIEKYIYFVEDTEKLENIQDVLKKDNKEFRFTNGKSPHFGYSTNKYWGYFRFDKKTDYNKIYITFSYPLIDFLYLDCYENSGNVFHFQAGDHVSIDKWNQKYRKPSFSVNNQIRECWISVVSGSSLQFPTTLYSEKKYNEEVMSDTFVQSIYYGGLLTILTYNILLSITTRIFTYLLYCLFLSSYGLFQASFSGIAFMYLWSDSSPYWIDKAVPFFISVAAIFSYLFTFLILDVKNNNLKIWNVSKYIFSFHLLHIIFLPLVPYKISLFWIFALAIIWAIYVIFIAIYLSIKGSKVAKIYLLAWTIFTVGTILNMLLSINLISRNIFTSNVQQIGSVVEFILLSILLGYKLNLIQAEVSKNLESEVKIKTNDFLLEKEKAEKLSQFSIMINREIDLQKILSTFYEFFESEFGIDGITIGLLDEKKNCLRFGYSSKPKVLSENHLDFLRNFEYELENEKNSLAIQCYEKKRDFFLSDTSKIPERANHKDKLLVSTLGIKTFYLYPLYSHESKFGVIYLTQFSLDNKLNRNSLKKIEPFLGQISATLYGSYMRSKSEELAEYHSVLREKAESEKGKAQRLQEMTNLVIGSDTIDQKLERLNGILDKKYNISSFTLYIMEKEKLINYKYFSSRPLPFRIMEIYKEKTIDLNEFNSIHFSVISSYKSILFKKMRRNQVSGSERFIIDLINIQNLFIIPLKVDGTPFGCISFCDSDYSIANVTKITKNQREEIEEYIKIISPSIYQSLQKDRVEKTLKELKDSQEKLVRSEKMAALGQLIDGVSHELNTPLGAIQASAENLVLGYHTSSEINYKLFYSISEEEAKILNEFLSQEISEKESLGELRVIKKEQTIQLETREISQAREITETLVPLGYVEFPIKYDILWKSKNVDVILQYIEKEVGVLKKTNIISTSVKKTAKIVSALKSFSEDNSFHKKRSTNIVETIESAITVYSNYIRKGIELEKEFSEVPEIICFPERLIQVWTHLLSNAIWAVSGQGRIIIAVKQERGEGDTSEILVSIEDNGYGISPEIQEKVFEPFFTTKKAGEGAGLGLHICKQIITQHGGSISIHSNLGKTIITVRLPV
jgi:signal transduction histidine kinase